MHSGVNRKYVPRRSEAICAPVVIPPAATMGGPLRSAARITAMRVKRGGASDASCPPASMLGQTGQILGSEMNGYIYMYLERRAHRRPIPHPHDAQPSTELTITKMIVLCSLPASYLRICTTYFPKSTPKASQIAGGFSSSTALSRGSAEGSVKSRIQPRKPITGTDAPGAILSVSRTRMNCSLISTEVKKPGYVGSVR